MGFRNSSSMFLQRSAHPSRMAASPVPGPAVLVDFPARFQLVAAATPCRRGCPSLDRCLSPPGERSRSLGRLSRPLLDRLDLHVELPTLTQAAMRGEDREESSATVRERVLRARDRQRARYQGTALRVNAELTARQLRRLCPVAAEAARLLDAAMDRLGLSARGHDRVLKVARTIADLEGAQTISAVHCAEAIQYRSLDRPWRG